MMDNIRGDHDRFIKIVKGKIKSRLQRYIVNDAFLGKEGSEIVKIPVPRIDIPRFTYRDKDIGGIGHGEGDKGDPAGFEPGKHIMEVEMSIDEVTDILIQKLELPYLEPKGEKFEQERQTKATVRKFGVRKNTRRTLKNALKRQISSGTYNPDKPIIIPSPEDFRYLVSETEKEEGLSAVIFYMLDISGSMGDKQKRICRTANSWLERIIKRKYPRVEKRYIVHDTEAKEVKEKEFYRLTSGGGTRLSAPYETFLKITENEYPQDLWNIYVFQYSDGENQSREDNSKCKALLAQKILPSVQVFGYGQCKQSGMNEGEYLHHLYQQFHLNEAYKRLQNKVRLSKLYGEDEVMETIKEFLRK